MAGRHRFAIFSTTTELYLKYEYNGILIFANNDLDGLATERNVIIEHVVCNSKVCRSNKIAQHAQ